MTVRIAAAFLLSCCLPLAVAGGEFAQFRGPRGCGVAPDQPIPTSWAADTNLAWSVKVPGSGWSQPIVWGDRLFLTVAVADQEMRPKNFSQGVRAPQSMGLGFLSRAPRLNIQWKVFCFSTVDGNLLWTKTIDSGQPKYPIHPSNTFATETPVADADGVCVYFGATGTVAGLSHDGTLLWKKDVGVFKTSNSFGTGSSLAIYDGKVFVQNLSEGSADVHCLDVRTGNTLWQVSRDKEATSWSTPVLWENGQRVELIISGDQQVDSLRPDTGETLWTVSNVKAATACSPCADEARIYFGGSDPFSKGPLFAVTAGAAGDLSPDKKNGSFDHCLWLQERAGPGMSSPVSSGQFVYVAANNILRCYDAETGERRYQKRLPKMRMVAASPVIIGDRVLLLDESGVACLVAVGPDFEVVGGGQIEDTFWATPAVADGAIFLRGVENLYCVRTTSS